MTEQDETLFQRGISDRRAACAAFVYFAIFSAMLFVFAKMRFSEYALSSVCCSLLLLVYFSETTDRTEE
jgi:hypothetical protein